MKKNANNDSPVWVVGHQRPDTDSAVSAVVYAALLNLTARGGEKYEGVILGQPTAQTRWLFDGAGVPLPRQISHLHPLVRDAARRKVFSLGEDASLGEAMQLVTRHRISVVPVLDDQRRLRGLLSDWMPMANYFYHANSEDFLGVVLSLADLERHLKLIRRQKPATPADGRITLDLSCAGPGDLVLAGGNPEALKDCHAAGAAGVIVCAPMTGDRWKSALRACRGLGVWQYFGSLMALVTQLPLAIPVRHLMQSEHFPAFTPDQTIEEVQSVLREARFAVPVLEPDGTLHGLLSRTEILGAPRRRVVLVDHFERHQAPEGIAAAEILEIVDHHRVGTLETPQPIRVDCRPVGSTATIIAGKFAECGRRPTPAQARLLLGAIIADTLLLASPTTTDIDRQQARALARRAGVDLPAFGYEVLVRNDETLERPPAELIEKDLKEFSGGGRRFAIAQVETADRMRLDAAHLEKFGSALGEHRRRGDWEFAALLITDIFRRDSVVLFDARSPAVARCLGPSGTVWSGCVSRKKQFLPELLRRLDAVNGHG